MSGETRKLSLQLHLLGRFEVRVGEQLVIDRSWSRRKAKAVIKLLALQHNHSLHREQVLDALWPDLDPAAAANQLHKNLHYLRTALAEHGLPTTLVGTTGDLVALSPEAWVDVDAFQSQAEQALAADDPALHEQALRLYVGDLLPEDIYEDWAGQPREDLRSLRIRLLNQSSSVYTARGQVELAIDRLQQLLQADVSNEDAHRALMRLYAQAGSRHRALRQYQSCRDALERELGVEPSEETEALHREIVEGRLRPDARTQRREDRPTIAPHPGPPISAPSLAPLFGRESELEMAEDALESALGGAGQALFVGGVAGIGKTHLARQVVAAAEQRGALGLAGRGYELEATVAYQPLREMLRQVHERAADGPVAQVIHRSLHIRRLLPQGETEAPPSADPSLLQLELFNEIGRLFGAMASQRPLVLYFDDLHLADEASLRLVHFLCRQLPQQPILLLATYRAEETGVGSPLAQLLGSLRRDRLLREIPLSPLPERAMHMVVEQVLDGQPVERSLAQEVAQHAEGNPLFVHELVHTLVEEGQVRFVDGRWQRRGAAAAPVPGAVQDLLDRRIQRLSESARQMLQVGSVLGREFEYGLVRRAMQAPEPILLDALDDGIAAFILEEAEQGYRFRHDLLREAVYSRLTRARRQQLHRSVAAALVEERAGRAEADVEVGYHLAQSDEPWRAVPYLQTAGGRAASVFANEQAIALYEQAIGLARAQAAQVAPGLLASLLEELGDLKTRAGDAAASVGLFEEAVSLLRQRQDQVGLSRVRGKAALGRITQGDVQGATELLEETMQAMTERSPQDVVSRTYYLLAQLHWHNARYREALEAADVALVAAESSGDPNQRARAYEALALACHSLGDWQRGVQYELSRQELGLAGFDTDEAFDAHL